MVTSSSVMTKHNKKEHEKNQMVLVRLQNIIFSQTITEGKTTYPF
jgi:hypothetical protein